MSAESPEATGTSRSNAERRILRRPEVEARIGFKRSQIYKLMNEGLFPK
ncbi:MAG: AlpA family transcriptional regulator, partial [Candidatus Accumulibacter sp.]|nr:AlpA family transcriptional regulator [Accumulibacter sp.]